VRKEQIETVVKDIDGTGTLTAVTTKRALVLAGGGLAGIAWETGVLRGIADESPATAKALLDSDVLVGTSAGSTVAAQLSSGLGLGVLFDRQVAASSTELTPKVGIDEITELFLTAMTQPNTTKAEKLQKIGAVALSTATVAEQVRREVIAQRLPSHDWPKRVLRISAIDTATGELVSFDRSSGVSLVDAVAASCAVPGVWPPVTIGDRRYMDGGVGSTVNLALADDCDVIVALLPQGRSTPSPFGSATEEVDDLGGTAFGVFADDESLAAFGANPLDPACRAPSALAGRALGRRVAGDIAAFLG
jgi:NTE family protein